MAKEKIARDDYEEVELEPAPAVPGAEPDYKEVTEKLGESFGGLSPNPKYDDHNVKGDNTPADMKDAGFSGELPTVIKNLKSTFANIKKLYVDGKPLADYIDSKGGVTEEELEDAISDKSTIYQVDDMEAISQEICELIKVGDMVHHTDSDVGYICLYKDASEISLVYVDASIISVIKYVFDTQDDEWVYDENPQTQFSSLGGTRLYMHKLSCTNQAGSKNYTFYCYSTSNESFAENTGSFRTISGILYNNDDDNISIIAGVPDISVSPGPNNVKYFTSNNMGMILVVGDTITEL